MRIPIANWIGIAWLGFFILWIAAAFTNKRTVQRQSTGSHLLQAAIMALGIALIFNFGDWMTSGWPAVRVIPASNSAAITGVALTAIGFLFAFWARAILGRNWSGTVTIKENHTLVRRGC
jgi:protein-S-isoprenylcysteine O-methyltransferase Ste14